MKKIFAVMLTLVMLLTVLTVPAFAKEPEDTFGDWNENAPALQALVSYVEEVTNAYSPEYIPHALWGTVSYIPGVLSPDAAYLRGSVL